MHCVVLRQRQAAPWGESNKHTAPYMICSSLLSLECKLTHRVYACLSASALHPTSRLLPGPIVENF